MSAWTGGCACGAIRFSCEAEPAMMVKCHCRDCQRASGSGYAAVVAFPKGAIALTGEPRYHTLTGGSGERIERGFCATCGNPVTVKLGLVPDVLGIQAGSLDEPARFKPGLELFTSSAQPWDVMDADTPKKAHGFRD
jgi:hypothetical protein